MADGRHVEKLVWLYLGAVSSNKSEIWNGHEESHADIGHMTKRAIFAKSRWRTTAILKIALSQYLNSVSDFNQI